MRRSRGEANVSSTDGSEPGTSKDMLTKRKKSLRGYANLDAGANDDGEANSDEEKDVVRDKCDMTSEAFHLFIAERRTDIKRKAEEERLLGLQRIADMKSRNGMDPFEIFPKEIWAEILEKISPFDRIHMCRVHPAFEDLMKSHLIRDTLLPLAMDYNLPFLEELDSEDSRSLRLVSKNIRNADDKSIEDDLIHGMRASVMKGYFHQDNEVEFRLTGNPNVLKQMQAHTSKLYVCRSLEIGLDFGYWESLIDEPDDEINEDEILHVKPAFDIFKDNLTQILEKVGHRVLRFEFSCCIIESILESLDLSFSQFYLLLRDWLTLTPDLKWLVLKLDDFGWNRPQKSKLEEMETVDAEILRDQPIPRLEGLERVDISENAASYNVFSICNAVFVANPHFKYHHYSGIHFMVEQLTSDTVLSLPLEKVKLGKNEYKDKIDVEFLREIKDSNWKLKEVKLWMNLRNDSIDKVFRCLQEFQTLEKLTIHVNNMKVEEMNFLRLPNLIKFKLEFGALMKWTKEFQSFFSQQFLLHCVKLKELIWYNHVIDSRKLRRELEALGRNEEAMVGFHGGFEDLRGSNSNVWDVFPRLEYIKVRFSEREKGQRMFYEREFRERKLVYESHDG